MDEELKRKVKEQFAGYRAASEFILEEQRSMSAGERLKALLTVRQVFLGWRTESVWKDDSHAFLGLEMIRRAYARPERRIP